MVHGACIAGGLMLAWSCDFVVASPDAFFSDPVVAVGLPGMEYFIHPHIMGARRAKEFLFTGRRVYAEEAKEFGMVNHVYPLDELEARTMELAESVAKMPRLGLALAKQAVNRFEDAMGLNIAIDAVFGLHQLGHSHNAETAGNPNNGLTPAAMLDVMNGAEQAAGPER
jgi:enoyl-CoA hydratase